MPEHETQRIGPGRRDYDPGCLLHREEMDALQTKVNHSDAEVSKTSGRFTAMLWFLGVVGAFLVMGISVLISKTSDIQTLLNKTDVILMQHTERIENLRKDVDDIKARNRYVDTQGIARPLTEKP